MALHQVLASKHFEIDNLLTTLWRNGKYHSPVYDGPLFEFSLIFEVVRQSYAKGNTQAGHDTAFFYQDLVPVK